MFTVAIQKADTVYFLKTQDVKPYLNRDDVVINPDLKAFRGISPHEMKIVNGVILRKDDSEILKIKETDAFHYKGLEFQNKLITKKSDKVPYIIGFGLVLHLIIIILIKKGLL